MFLKNTIKRIKDAHNWVKNHRQLLMLLLAIVIMLILSGCYMGDHSTMLAIVIGGVAGGKHVVDEPLTTDLTREAAPDLLLNEIDQQIVKIRPMATPIDQLSRCAGSKHSGSMIVEYHNVDTKPTLTTMSQAYSEPDDGEATTDSTRPIIHTANDEIFDASDTILVQGTYGYEPDGVTQSMLSLYLSSALGGQNLTNVWEGDYKVPVMLYTRQNGDSLDYQELEDFLIPTSVPGTWVPLRQVAEVSPEWRDAVIHRRNSIRTVTVGADLNYGYSQPDVMKKIDQYVNEELKPNIPDNVEISYGGLTGINGMVIPEIALSFLAAVLVLFVFLLYHFGRLDIVFLTLSASLICVFGACLGLWLFGLDFSITAVLGVVSLIGIIVRNAIIMFEYAESLRKVHRKSAKEAAFEAGRRRMRPIFLTSATTALGVMPMIIAHTNLWMPMGVVICFGTIFSLPLVVTVLPVAYWQIFK